MTGTEEKLETILSRDTKDTNKHEYMLGLFQIKK